MQVVVCFHCTPSLTAEGLQPASRGYGAIYMTLWQHFTSQAAVHNHNQHSPAAISSTGTYALHRTERGAGAALTVAGLRNLWETTD